VLCISLTGCKSCKDCYRQQDSVDQIAYATTASLVPPNGLLFQDLTPVSTFRITGVRLYLKPGGQTSDVTVSIMDKAIPPGNVLAGPQPAFIDHEGWYAFYFDNTTLATLSAGVTYYIVLRRDTSKPQASDCAWDLDGNGSFFYQTFSDVYQPCSQGGLAVEHHFSTNSLVAWTTPDDITIPGTHPFTMTYLSRDGYLEGETNLIFFTLPPATPVSATMSLVNLTLSNAPDGILYYGIAEGAAGMGALYVTNFPQFSNTVFLQTSTGTNVAIAVTPRSLISIRGTNGVAPMQGELVWAVTNALCPTPAEVALSVTGTYDFDAREASWETANWSFHVPTIPPVAALPAVVGDRFKFLFQSVVRQPYVVLFTEDLVSNNWQLLTNLDGDGSVREVVDPISSSGQRFYRVISP
jgi:hypothetical protein